MSLTPKEMRSIAHVLSIPVRWEPLVDHKAERSYTLLDWTEDFNAWLICWSAGHETGFHDHDGSAVCYKIMRGELMEDTLACVDFGCYLAHWTHHEADLVELGPYDIHNVRHVLDEGVGEPAVSIHVYSPPLVRMGSYKMVPGERLSRLPMTHEQPLRPLEIGALEHARHDEDGSDTKWDTYPNPDTRITG